MDFTLLTPGAAVLAASVAFPTIVALYLLKLRRKPVRVSSTLLWAAATHDLEANAPLRWLRRSWLLLLHLIIGGLLCLAIGRPAIAGAPGEGRRTVILIDRSASMAAADAGEDGTRLEEAKRRALELAQAALEPDGATVSVVSFAAQPRSHCPPTDSLRLVRDALNDIRQSDERADLSSAALFVDASGDMSEDSSSYDRARVVLFSDGSFAEQRRPTLTNATFSFFRCGPAPSAEGVANRGIVVLAARRDYEDPARVRVLVRVLNAEAKTRTAVLSLSVNGELVERRPLAMPGATEAGPAAVSTTFERPLPQGGLITVRIEDADLIAADNSASVAVLPAARARVTLVRPDGIATGTASVADFLLADALAELAPGALTTVTATEFKRREDAGSLAAGELYVFDRVAPRLAPPGPSLSLGSELPHLGLSLARPSPRDSGGSYVLAWERSHPVLRDVALDSVFLTEPLTIRSSPETDPRVRRTDLATGASGPVMVLLEDGQFRRVVVCFELDRSNWPLQVGFPIFLAASADFLTLRAEASAGVSFSTGTSFELTPVPLRPGSPYELVGPVNLRLLSRDDGNVTVAPLEAAGVYRLDPDGIAAAVNLLDETESAARTTDNPPVAASSGSSRETTPVRRELWRPLALIASILLTVEWLLFARRARV